MCLIVPLFVWFCLFAGLFVNVLVRRLFAGLFFAIVFICSFI